MSTIVAPCTPAGGALGVLRISGPQAIQRTSPLFHPMSGAPLTQRPGYSLVFGHLMDGDEVLDEVMVSVFRAPHSFTGEDVVEISCHGSQYIIQRTLQLLIAAGCQMALNLPADEAGIDRKCRCGQQAQYHNESKQAAEYSFFHGVPPFLHDSLLESLTH